MTSHMVVVREWEEAHCGGVNREQACRTTDSQRSTKRR